MKIDARKNYQAIEKDLNNFKTDNSVFIADDQINTVESGSAQKPGAFAKIFDEARKPEEKDNNNSSASKNKSSENASKSSKSETDGKIIRQSEEKKKLERRNGQNGGSNERQPEDESQSTGVGLAAFPLAGKPVSENASPAARKILHIADLERIISTIRSENFQNEKKVTIALKNSILEGLQIKLTIDNNGQIKAEFLAINEQLKKQLNLRKKELSEILRNRAAVFAEIEISSPNNAGFDFPVVKKNDKDK